MLSKMTHVTIVRTIWFALLALTTLGWAEPQKAWEESRVDWRAGAGRRIKAIRYPKDRPPPTKSPARQRDPKAKKALPRTTTNAAPGPAETSGSISALSLDVNNPPVSGFVPYIAIVVTQERKGELEMEAEPQDRVVGRYPSGFNPQTQYAIGIFDTGASGHVMGYAPATQMGLFTSKLISKNQTIVLGVVGSVDVWVSQPLGLFIDGLGAIDPQTTALSTQFMKGQTNVAIIVGEQPTDRPDLVTAIGSPMSVFFTTHIRNDLQVSVTRNGQVYTGPDVKIYSGDDPCVPTYENTIPMELRPLGAVSVQYMPSLDLGDLGGLGDLGDLGGLNLEPDFSPASPSVIMGNLSQSLFFIHSVDLFEADKAAMDKSRFMFDTGAQVSVIGSRIAARLGLNPKDAEFEVEIQDVTGLVSMAPGFYVDSLQIPAIGEWFTARNVPVVLMDVASPEGGRLDGIIGMNLLVDFNLVLRGGGMYLGEDPTLEFSPILVEPELDPKAGASTNDTTLVRGR